MFDPIAIVRKNIKELIPYSSARDDFQGTASVYLDANENPYATKVNRYPDPLQQKLKVVISKLKHVTPEQIFLGNGSDEAIDLLYRAFCEPAADNVVSIKPTYGMYKVCADINNISYREVLLKKGFTLDVEGLLSSVDESTKLLFLCSPNNPTGNSFDSKDILQILDSFKGIVVVDEAYIDFSEQKSFLTQLNKYPNLVVLQTLSKAWGMAGIRLGMAFASKEIINILNSIKYPYNVNSLTQKKALKKLKFKSIIVRQQVQELIDERNKLAAQLKKLGFVEKVYASDANFLLVEMKEAEKVYLSLMDNKIIVRDRSKVALCEGCLRITIGTSVENLRLLRNMKCLNEAM